MIYKFLPLFLFVFLSFKTNPETAPKTAKLSLAKLTIEAKPEIDFNTIYHNLQTNNLRLPKQESFTKALESFYYWKEKGMIKKEMLTIVDFSISSNEKRLWVIDLKNNQILFQSLVAHGKNSGGQFANSFSNRPESHQSSLGCYATAETYIGKHGYSLRLDGLENAINNNARKRAIVMHGADYVSDKYIAKNGRLGRSFGCPSVPNELTVELIDIIKDKSCLYIYYPSNS